MKIRLRASAASLSHSSEIDGVNGSSLSVNECPRTSAFAQRMKFARVPMMRSGSQEYGLWMSVTDLRGIAKTSGVLE